MVMFVIPLPQNLPMDMMSFLFILIEVGVGLIIGFTAYLIMAAIEFGGMLMDTKARIKFCFCFRSYFWEKCSFVRVVNEAACCALDTIMNGHHLV